LNFQDASSLIIEELIGFHDHTLMVALAIWSLVLYLLTHTLTEKPIIKQSDAQVIEII
ncbi:COX2 oxidase, partial [Nesospiza acunhae]|nr:COX2 oxidase [Nesospiza acunhae]